MASPPPREAHGKGEGAVTRVYREDPEACAEAVLYVLKMRDLEQAEEEEARKERASA